MPDRSRTPRRPDPAHRRIPRPASVGLGALLTLALSASLGGCGEQARNAGSTEAPSTSSARSAASKPVGRTTHPTRQTIDLGYATFSMPAGWAVKPYKLHEAGPEAVEGYVATEDEARTVRIAAGGYPGGRSLTVSSIRNASDLTPAAFAKDMIARTNSLEPPLPATPITLDGSPAWDAETENGAQVAINALHDGRLFMVSTSDATSTDLKTSRKLVEDVRRSWRWARK